MNDQYDLLCLGAGSGGLASAIRAASYGARVAIVEAGEMGGTCVNVGCVPKKILWNASHVADILNDCHNYGFDVQHQFDWQRLKTHRDAYVQRSQQSYQRALKNNNITLIQGHGQFINANTIAVDGKHHQAKHIIIATGSYPIWPDIPGAELGITSDEFFALEQQPKNIAVIGAGYIAVELAGLLNALGSKVSLALRFNKALRSFDDMLSDALLDAMQQQNINVLCQHIPSALQKTEHGLQLSFENGETLSDLDCVLWAVGRDANTNDLDLQHCGVNLASNKTIVVDEQQKTNIESIYALGDVTGRAPLTPVAIAAGRALSDRLFGNKPQSHFSYDWIPTVIFSHPPIGTVGLTEQQAREQFDDVKIYGAEFTDMFSALQSHSVKTRMKLIVHGDDEKILGCHILGFGADEMLQGFAVAISMGATKKDFDNTLAIHPTSGEELVTMR